MIHEVRVIFGDTDQMGVVYYANYLRFFESARAAYWRSLGQSNADLDRMGVALPVVEAHCRYRRPAHYEDLLAIDTRIGQVRGASVRFDYQVTRIEAPGRDADGSGQGDGQGDGGHAGGAVLLAEGWTRHAIVSTGGTAVGRPRALPAELRALITAHPA